MKIRESYYGRIVILMSFAFFMVMSAINAFAQKDSQLIMVITPEAPTLAAYLSTAQPVGQVASKVYDGLLEYDFNLKPIPGLAQSWEVSPDGKKITFHLRKGIKWHDGKDFTSNDVKFTFEQVLKKYHPRGTLTFEALDNVGTPDDYTAVFNLKVPAPYILIALSSYESPIVPKHLLEGTDIRSNPLSNNPVGTGPFRFVEWIRGQYIRLDRNKDYWKPGLPKLDRIIVRFISDASTITAVMETGEANVVGFGKVPLNDLKMLKKNPNVVVTTKGYEMLSSVDVLSFNTKRKPFDDVRVRQAVSYAIDRNFVINAIHQGYGRLATGPLNSNYKSKGYYTDNVTNYNLPNGVEIANKILDDAGYKRDANGIRFEIVHDATPYGEQWRRLGEYVVQVLSKIGIKATLRYEDTPTWLRRIYTDYDFFLTSDSLSNFGDPVIGVHRMYHTNSIKPGTVFVNCSRWSSPETDAIMDAATVELDETKRAELYKTLQKKLVDAAPVVWVMESENTTVHSSQFKELIISPLGTHTSFEKAYFEK